MSDYSRPSEELSTQWSSLQSQWSQCRNTWNDAVSDRFERDFWIEWETSIPEALRLLQSLEEAINHAERDLEQF
jgi:uncharacterized protein YukE